MRTYLPPPPPLWTKDPAKAIEKTARDAKWLDTSVLAGEIKERKGEKRVQGGRKVRCRNGEERREGGKRSKKGKGKGDWETT